MERKINRRIDDYFIEFKDNIRDKLTSLNINDNTNNILQFIYDYERLTLTKDDFMKRKRIKNTVPFCERCSANRANGEQCTRRKKEEDNYCGTHMKGTPHGIIEIDDCNKQTIQKIEVWVQDIQGIVYYIDKSMNVYQAEDIISNKPNPKIIAKYVKTGDIYTIPSFGI